MSWNVCLCIVTTGHRSQLETVFIVRADRKVLQRRRSQPLSSFVSNSQQRNTIGFARESRSRHPDFWTLGIRLTSDLWARSTACELARYQKAVSELGTVDMTSIWGSSWLRLGQSYRVNRLVSHRSSSYPTSEMLILRQVRRQLCANEVYCRVRQHYQQHPLVPPRTIWSMVDNRPADTIAVRAGIPRDDLDRDRQYRLSCYPSVGMAVDG